MNDLEMKIDALEHHIHELTQDNINYLDRLDEQREEIAQLKKEGFGINELVFQVEEWSKDKFLNKADSSKQFLKVTEEVGEVASALARGNREGLKDGIGDVVVTLIILAQQNGLSIEECLLCAYKEIKDRKGKMVNGVFVKESDLVD